MKKVSIYSLLFALLALSPLPIKAETTSRALINKFVCELGAPLCGLGLGIIGIYSLNHGFKKFEEAQSAGESYWAEQLKLVVNQKKSDKYLAQAKSSETSGRIFMFLGKVSLVGATYFTYTAIQQILNRK